MSSADRVKRLLLMLPWLAQQHGGVEVADMARQFDISEDELISELEYAATCGIPPYTPDALAGIIIHYEDGYIECHGAVQFDRSLSLSLDEAFGLALLGTAAGKVKGFRRSRALKSALKKLEKVLGQNSLAVDLETPEYLEILSDAATSGERLQAEYWNPTTNVVTPRTVTVRRVFWQEGHWYVLADDSAHDNERRFFRVDRFRAVTPTGEFAEVVAVPGGQAKFFSDASFGVETVLNVGAPALWVTENYRNLSMEEQPDGSFTVHLVARRDPHWMGRLLLRGRGQVRVQQPKEWENLLADTATQVLARYSEAKPGN